MDNSNNITSEKTVSKITVRRVFESEFQKEGTMSAELEQKITVVSHYPSMRIDNNKQDNIFEEDDFGVSSQEFISEETRITWLPVPAGKTVEEVQALIDGLDGACLYKVLSNEPILTNNQKSAINNGITTLDKIAMGQIVRFPNSHEKAGEICLDPNEKVQYRKIYFKKSAHDDLDLRTNEKDEAGKDMNTYVPEAALVELASYDEVNQGV